MDLMADFGWELLSSQEINASSVDFEPDDFSDTITVTTTKENYVKLVFTRDTNISNYELIASKERKWNQIHDRSLDRKAGWLVWAIILAHIGLVSILVGFISKPNDWWVGLVVGIIPCGLSALFVFFFVKTAKQNKVTEKYNEDQSDRRSTLRYESRQLLK